jgi:hypothetical protein
LKGRALDEGALRSTAGRGLVREWAAPVLEILQHVPALFPCPVCSQTTAYPPFGGPAHLLAWSRMLVISVERCKASCALWQHIGGCLDSKRDELLAPQHHSAGFVRVCRAGSGSSRRRRAALTTRQTHTPAGTRRGSSLLRTQTGRRHWSWVVATTLTRTMRTTLPTGLGSRSSSWRAGPDSWAPRTGNTCLPRASTPTRAATRQARAGRSQCRRRASLASSRSTMYV